MEDILYQLIIQMYTVYLKLISFHSSKIILYQLIIQMYTVYLKLISFHSSKIIHGRYPVPAYYTVSLSYYLSFFPGFMHPKWCVGNFLNHQKNYQLLGGTSGPSNLEIPSFGISEAKRQEM